MEMFLKGFTNQNLWRIFLGRNANSVGHLLPEYWTLRGQKSRKKGKGNNVGDPWGTSELGEGMHGKHSRHGPCAMKSCTEACWFTQKLGYLCNYLRGEPCIPGTLYSSLCYRIFLSTFLYGTFLHSSRFPYPSSSICHAVLWVLFRHKGGILHH